MENKEIIIGVVSGLVGMLVGAGAYKAFGCKDKKETKKEDKKEGGNDE
jgi:hypothetical protein